jgi:ergothioneine biosynthesis protein EgtB
MTTVHADRHLTDVSFAAPLMLRRYAAVRSRTQRLCAPLAIEDYVVTAMTDTSPAKWHLAHTTWFFETFVLLPHVAGYRVFDPAFAYLFNSYYVQAGERHCRAQRGLVTRPTVAEVYTYRAAVDEAIVSMLHKDVSDEVKRLVELGLQHEQQHQELLLTDLKYLFYANPIKPAYDQDPLVGAVPTVPPDGETDLNLAVQGNEWIEITPGVAEFGVSVDRAFSYDNEGPRHPRYLSPARLATRLVTNEEYAAFIRDDGYKRAELWLSAGWATAQDRRWDAPLYWERDEDTPLGWRGFTLAGMQPLAPHDPVYHVSYYEADAYARWRSMYDVPNGRLPTEFEWEALAPQPPDRGDVSFLDGVRSGRDAANFYGTVWQWTMSPYVGYPGYRPRAGALGEYNGKFMSDQWVLRGGSIATPPGHTRRTYRNFFPADARWQFCGIRLAADA